MRIVLSLVIAVICGIAVTACSTRGARQPKFIEDIRPVPPALKVTSYTIQRRDMRGALSDPKDNSIRLVPVYQNVSSAESYEYRVFDVTPTGVYSLLGLQNSDIIVAVDRYLLKDPRQFPLFVQLLPNENEAQIEIRRGGEAQLLKYSFVPAVDLKQ